MNSLLDLDLYRFNRIAHKISLTPDDYLDFDSVSDVYKAKWLDDFPRGTTCSISGLDDGADEFYILIQYKMKKLNIEVKQGHYKIDMNV